MMTLFTLNLTLSDNTGLAIDYDGLDECRNDDGMKGLFDDDLVERCSITIDDKRITALPRTDITWKRLDEHLESNRKTLGD